MKYIVNAGFLASVLVLLLVCSQPALARGGAVMVDADTQFHLAQSLMDDHEYLPAGNEFVRFTRLFPDHPRVFEAYLSAGVSFLHAGRNQEAVRYLSRAADGAFPDAVSVTAVFELSRAYAAADRFGDAVMALRNLAVLSVDDPTTDRAYAALGWLMLDHGEQIRAGSDHPLNPVQEAKKYFSRVSDSGRQIYGVDEILAGLDRMQALEQKDPALAGLLAVIPGGGFLYCGRYRDALVSFLLNTSLILAAYQAFDDGNPYLGGAIAFFESGFYAGNIYGSVTSAHKYNRNQEKEQIDQLRRDHAEKDSPLSFRFGLKRSELALTVRFSF
jgi:tetratricopeptide (TPR) repeat protein